MWESGSVLGESIFTSVAHIRRRNSRSMKFSSSMSGLSDAHVQSDGIKPSYLLLTRLLPPP